jgi:hypothetical protein
VLAIIILEAVAVQVVLVQTILLMVVLEFKTQSMVQITIGAVVEAVVDIVLGVVMVVKVVGVVERLRAAPLVMEAQVDLIQDFLVQ